MIDEKRQFSGFNDFGNSKWNTVYTGVTQPTTTKIETDTSEDTFTQDTDIKGYRSTINEEEGTEERPELFINRRPENFNLNSHRDNEIVDITAGTIIGNNNSPRTYNTKTGTNTIQEKISKSLQSQLGLTPWQAAGILTHINGESGFKVEAENAAEKAGKNSAVKSDEYGIGLIQWTGGRHRKFKNYVRNHGGKADEDTQINFMVDEIKNDYKDYLAALKMARTPEEASDITYIMYVGGGKRYGVRNSTNIDDLMKRVSTDSDALSLKYQKKHGELGYTVQDHRTKRKNDSVNFVYAKRGGFLPRKKNG